MDLYLNQSRLRADLSGAIYFPGEDALIVADLHFAKGARYAAQGVPLPPYDTRRTVQRLSAAIRRYRARRVVCLGDSFDDCTGVERLSPSDRDTLRRTMDGIDWIWIAGNHDPSPAALPGGRVETQIALGGVSLRHEADSACRSAEISGHFHPKARITARGRRQTRRCFATDGKRLILPAFGAYAGGLDVLDPAISGLFRDGFDALVLGDARLHRIPAWRLG